MKQTHKKLLSIFIASISSLLFGVSITSFGILERVSNSFGHPFLSTLAIANVFLGGVVGAILLNFYTDFTSKHLTIVSSSLHLLGNLIALGIPNIYIVLVARGLIGVGCGISGLTVPVYVFQLSPPNLKGVLSNLHPMNINIGIILGHSLSRLNTMETYRVGLGIICMLSLLSIVLALFTEEIELTPKNTKGLRALIGYNQSHRSIQIVSLFHLAQHLSGIDYVIVFLQKILQDTKSPFYYTLGIISLSVPSNLLCGYLLDKFGRRPLMILSCLTIALSCLFLSLFNLPQIYVMLFIIGYNSGLSNVPWLMPNELAPPDYTNSLSSLGVQVNWLSAFFIVQLFVFIQSIIKSYIWLLYGFFMVLIAVYTYFLVPETNRLVRYDFVN